MNKSIKTKIEGVLSRSEMKKLKAGTFPVEDDGLRRCGCNYNDALLGHVWCSEDISSLQCCQVHYPSTQTTSCP